MELDQVMTALRNADAAGDTDAAQRLAQIAKGMMGGMGEMTIGQPPKPAEGIGAALKGGFKRYGSSLETALESIIDPQKAAERGLERGRGISEQYAPGASLERVKQKYEQEGLFPAAREAIGQIPAALAEQTPNIAAALGGARLGAMAGAPIGGPVGALIGGGIGAAAAALPQLYASNLERQAQEGQPVERSSALGAAIPGAAAEVASQFIPLGRGLVGKILGPTAEKALAKGTDEAIERAARETVLGSVARGAGVGLLAEIPTEVSQQMLERLQAGLPLTTPDALAEYGEAAYGAGLVGLPFGVAGRTMGRPAARAEFEARQQEKMMTETPPAVEAPTDITQMPGGYAVQREEIMGGMRPETFNITMPGAETPLASVDTEEEAQKKLESFTQIRQQERENALKEIEGINEGVQKMQSKLDYMEATGQANTEEYTQLKANLPAYMENAAQKSAELHDKIEMYGKPLEIVPVGEKQQVQEAYKVLDKAGQTVNTFPTLGEAEAHVRDIVGEKPFKQAQQQAETIKALEQQLVPAMQKFGLKDVGLKVVANIENNAGGAYFNKLMRVAMDEANPLQTMRHESVHALKDLGFFTPQQWKALEERAKKEWIKTHLEGQQTEIDGQPMTRLEGYRKLGLSEDAIIEEAIADAFAAYDKGQTPPPGLIAQLFKRLKQFFANLGQAMRGAGFESADDIFQRIERGELKPSLKGAESAKTGEIKYAKKPASAQEAIDDGVKRLVESARKHRLNTLEERFDVGLARADTALTKIQDGIEKRLKDLGVASQPEVDDIIQNKVLPAVRSELKKTARYSLSKPSEWKATKADIEQAQAYEEENGILPYTSEGQLDVPLDVSGTKYSIKMPYEQKAIERSVEKAREAEELRKAGKKDVKKVKVLKNDPITGLPLNQNGTVTLYYPTTNDGARKLAKSKKLSAHSPTANRIYLTNESAANVVADNPGMIDQPLGGANVLLQVDPSLLELAQEYPNGRKDFFIPIAEGAEFAKKMKQTKLFTLNKARTEGLHPDRKLSEVTESIEKTAKDWENADAKERAAMYKRSKDLLMAQHNVSTLFGANAKLEKTNIGEYGLTYEGKNVISTGLGFASAQKISDLRQESTCVKSAICEALCLGETSGQNELYGGEGPFRSGPRLSQFLKTEAFIVNPEAFTASLIRQIELFRNEANKLGYYPSIRLNVTSDFPGKMFKPIMDMFPDVMFYDYTKLTTAKPVAPNHHLTYSSTGASQNVNGEAVFNKESNWDQLVNKVLPNGMNVAMAFTSRTDMPKFVKDARTGQTFEVWNGDEYDARFLDPKRPDGVGWIIGLTNKDRTTAPEEAAKKHNGFFLDYNKERDGDTLVIPDQSKFKKGEEKPVAFVAKPKYSLKQIKDIFNRAEKIEEPPGVEAIREQWIGGVSGVGDRDSMYDLYRVDGSKKYIQDVQDFVREELGDKFNGYRLMSNDELEELQTGAMGSQFVSFTLNPDVAKAFKNIPAYADKTGMSVIEMELTPEHVNMIGHPGELELVVDYGQGYNPSEIKVIEKYSLKKASFATPEAAERAAYKKAPPSTPEFKRWFGASQIMDEGRPQVMYHASPNEFDTFSEFKPIFVSPDADKAQQFSALKRLGKGAKKDYIYPLWVRAETPFDYENSVHVGNLLQEIGGQMGMNEFIETEKEIKRGNWSKIEDPRTQAALQKLGFDSFYVFEGNTKNLAVFSGNQVKSVTGNTGDFSIEDKNIRYSLRKFDSDDLPEKNVPFTLPQNTMLFHGAHKEAAQKIKDAGHVLLSYPNVKSSGGTLDEGGLIFFGDEETASNFANQRADLMSVAAAEKRGETRLPGTVFETATDRPYRLMSRYHKLTKQQADDLNKALGIPDYKPLKAGDDANLAASRAYTNSDTIKREKIPNKGEIASPWPVIFKTLGFDGFYDNQNAPAIALTANNGIRLIGKDGKLEKYSLPQLTANEDDAVNRLTTVRESKGFMERILGALSPENYTYYRQQALNRYEALSVADKIRAQKIGNVALMADQSAETAALMSDLHSGVAASVFGIQGRRGGVPVFRNGITTVDHTKKGLVEVLSPLAKYGDPKVYRHFQLYAAVKRGHRLMVNGPQGYTEKLIQPGDIALADSIRQKYMVNGVDVFENVRKDWVAFNDAVTDYLVQTGVLSKADATRFKQYADYIPFYRQLEGEKTLGPNIFQSMSGVKKPKALGKGGEAPLADFMETVVRNTHAAITAGMKNTAEQRVIKVGKDINIVHDIQPGTTVPEMNKIKVLINGVKHEYQCSDQMFAEATRSLHMPDLPFMSFLSAPANLLRNFVTREPGFIMTNLLRDSMSAYVTSGANITPIAGTAINFAKAMKGNSPAFEALMDAGIIGGYEFSANIEQSGEKLTADLMKKAGKGPAILKPFTSVWDGLEHATTASDAATRMAVYERVLAETGNEAEALSRALEVMNFNRKGSSAVVRILTAAVPFLNARMQGLDLFYRSMTGKMNNTDAKEIQAKFFTRGMMLLGMSTMYYFAVAGDPEYEKQEQETKDNNWIIPGAGIRIPIPFEVGILFKTIPERIAAYTFGNDTGKDFLDAMKRAGNGFIPVSPSAYIPQTFKPIIEAMTNYSFFTQREIVGMGLKDVAPEYQVGPGTSAFAEFVGKTLGLSPIKVDHVFKGYTGTMGMYAVDLMDVVMDVNSDSPKPTKRFEQMPIIKRFAADPEARGNVTNYYQLKDSVDTAVRTMNLLEKSGDPKEFAEYVKDNAGLLAFRSYVNDLEKTMKELRDMKKQVQNSPMTGDEKRDAIKAIGQAENNLTVNIQTVKKVIESVKP